MKRFVGLVGLGVGVALVGLTIWLTIEGMRNPSPRLSASIALFGSIGVPVGLASLSAGWKHIHGPNSYSLRMTAQAQARAAAALDDAEAAEGLKKQMLAYIELRARNLDIERRRSDTTVLAQRFLEAHGQLNDDERQLEIKITAMGEETRAVVDAILKPRRRWDISSGLPGLGGVVARALEDGLEASRAWLERRRLRRLATLAPDSFEPPEASSRQS